MSADLDALKIDRSEDRRRKGSGLWILIVVLTLIAAGWYFRRLGGPAPVKIRTALATSTSTSEARTVLNASGYVTARRRATVSSETTGKVSEIFIEEGQAVKKGQLLARLDSENIDANFKLAQAQVVSADAALEETRVLLADARKTLGRSQKLLDDKIVSQAAFDSDQAGVDGLAARLKRQQEELTVSRRQVDVWRRQLEDTEIRAPFEGIVISKDAQPGEMISPVSAGGGFTRTGIGTIVDMTSLEIEIDVNESYINRVSEGQKVTATLDAYPDWQIACAVLAIIPTADRQKATVRVRIAIEERDPRILPDMGVKVGFRDAEPSATSPSKSVSLPLSALREEKGQDVVYVLNGQKLERRAVTRGGANGNEVNLIAGVNAGERVMVEGPAEVSDGMLVEEDSRESK